MAAADPPRNAGRAFALVLVDELVRHGVAHAVLAPGSRSTPIALAFAEHPGIRLHVRIDERSAAYLALGIAKANGLPVPLLCTSGTATSYFLGAVMEADQARVPLLVLTADRPPELRGVGANQTVDQVGMYDRYVRWSADVGVPESRPDSVRYWRSLVSRAVAACAGVPPGVAGPVHLNLPLREPLTDTDDGVGFPFGLDGRVSPSTSTDRRPDSWTSGLGTALAASQAFPRRFRQATRGVIVAGDTLDTVDADSLVELTTRVGWPLIAEPHSNARHGDATLRSTDALLRDPDFLASHRPDLVVVCGRVGLSRATLGWLATVPHVVIDEGGGWWDVTRSADSVLTWPIRGLVTHGPEPADPSWLADWKAASERVGAAIDAELDASPTLTEPQVARDVAALVPEDAALVVASSMPIRDLDLTMRPRELLVFANRGVSGIDGFVSTAQGIALEYDGPTYALCGDLSLLHDVNGLIPGPDPRPDVTYVVVNNDGGGIFSLLPQAQAGDTDTFERLFGTSHGMSIERLAAAYDVTYTLVHTGDELAAALASYGGVRIVEVRTDRAANAALHDRLRQVAAEAVRTPG
jgi:2-succinyl-5-enolpyruvyl-6-hydroxy-3-cyclohexene-1-carboxylate synthase